MWKNYEQINDPYKKNLALERIANILPILSAYVDSANIAIEKMFPNAFKDYYNNNNNNNNSNRNHNNMISE